MLITGVKALGEVGSTQAVWSRGRILEIAKDHYDQIKPVPTMPTKPCPHIYPSQGEEAHEKGAACKLVWCCEFAACSSWFCEENTAVSGVSPPCCQQGNVTSWHLERSWKALRPGVSNYRDRAGTKEISPPQSIPLHFLGCPCVSVCW